MEKASEPKIFSLSDLPKRPKPGDTNHGAKQSFITNYYKISFNEKNQMFYQFEMTFEPEIPKDSRGAIRAALKSCHKELEQKIGYYVPRGTMIWTFRPPEAALSFKCNITSTGKDSSSYDYILHLKKTREFSLNNMHSGNKDAQQVLQVLNSQLKKTLQAVNMIEIGRNSKYYNPKYINQNRVDGSRLKVWRGFTTSIQIISGIAYLMVDVSTRVLRDESLLETIQRLSKDEVNDLVGATILA
jgi:aubergine-like protein